MGEVQLDALRAERMELLALERQAVELVEMADGAADIDALADSLEAAKAAHAELTDERERVQSERNDQVKSLSVSGVSVSIEVQHALEAKLASAAVMISSFELAMAHAQLAEIAPLVLAADRRYVAAQAARDEAVATAEAELESARNELQRVDAQRRDASERVQWLTARGVVA